MKEPSPKYNPAEVEAGRYQKWLDADVFKPSGDQKAKPYSIVIPPPNVTGKLHLGHAWDTTLQDITIRHLLELLHRRTFHPQHCTRQGFGDPTRADERLPSRGHFPSIEGRYR